MEPASGVILWFDPAFFLQMCTGKNISPERLGFCPSVGCLFKVQGLERFGISALPFAAVPRSFVLTTVPNGGLPQCLTSHCAWFCPDLTLYLFSSTL